jgi:hypothetical protein
LQSLPATAEVPETMRKIPLHAALLLFCACASNPTPPANSSESDAAPAETTASDDSAMESQREPFIQGCIKKASAPEYCACAFEQFRIVFKGVDLNQPLEEGDPRLQTLQKKTIAACSSKIDEAQVRSNFLEQCVENEPKKKAYCECAWPALRKDLELAELLGNTESLRFFAAKKQMTAICKGKFPVDVAKREFMQGCIQEPGSSEKMCGCLWNKVIARFTAEEIAAGTADLKNMPELAKCK